MTDCPKCNQPRLKLLYERRSFIEMEMACGGCGYKAPRTPLKIRR